MVAAANPIVGSHVWVEDSGLAWIDGEILEVNGEEIKVLCTSGKMVVVKAPSIYHKDTEVSPSGVDDMTKLAYLHEPGVLENLRSRYDINEIYTYTGNILIAVNPFIKLPHLYDSHMMAQYKGAAFGELSPHPFAVADAAYRLMINEGIIQSILVSGESGAGKTESTKLLMRYLAYMGGRAAAAEGRTVEQKVLESNRVLEAFGNAKTVRNNNSSRFSKLVEIQFDQRGRISGAAIRTYLLERSRVCQVSDPDRNYHCFYMLCAAPQEEVKKYKLGNPKIFHYLNQSNCYELEGVDESNEYLATRRAMDGVGISSEEQDAIFRVVAAILHLGNIEFVKGKEIDSSVPKDEKSRFHLQTAAELFMCDAKALEDSLCKRLIVTRDETITKWLDPEAAVLSRDALAKIVYTKLFDWLVDKINNSIGQDPEPKSLIGVLDIYGFESFKINSFEQFCINLTNEKLQQHFNQHVFKMEQEEYKIEEIDWSYIEFVDNQDILDLIEKKPGGIIALLDEACMFPRSTHETFAQKLYQTFKNHERFSKPKLARSDFTICHYAGDVTYETKLFLDKNKDYVVAEHQALLYASKCPFVSDLLPPSPEESSKQSKFSSIGSRFRQQLQSLLEILSATEPHYIHCVKPNNLLKPAIFENKNVLLQLRCGGVMEAIRISCAGYPTRKSFNEFVDRFGLLASDALDGSVDEISACKRILEDVGLEGYQIGKTKVFLRAGQMVELDTHRSEILGKSASIIQRKVRSYLARRSFVSLRLPAVQIQAACRGQLARQVYEGMRLEASTLMIQRYFRMHVAKKAYKELYISAVCIQTGMRAMAARCELWFRRRTRAAIVIQGHCRKYLARLHFTKLKKTAWFCGGVMEAIRISGAGYPTRKSFDEFVDRFGLLAPDTLDGSVDEISACNTILKKVGLKGYQIGKTKVFLRAGQMAELDTRRSEILGKSASIIQRKVRLYLAHQSFVSLRLSAVLIQAACRGQLARQVYEGMRQEASSLMIQRYFRMHVAKKAYKELYTSAVHIQTGMRGMAARCSLWFRRRTRAPIVIQSHCRKYLARLHFTKLKKAALKTQCAWRGKVARQELQKLKMAAREIGALQAAKNKLEKQVEDLTLRLQLEKCLRVDMEEAKTRENEKLQSALQDMQIQFEETKVLLEKEREATKGAMEREPVIQEVPVVDHSLIEKLSTENEKLKNLVSSLEKKIDEAEKRYEEANRIGEERLKQALDAESKVIQLKTAMQRLEEKLSDMNYILQKESRLNSNSNSSVKTIAEHISTPVYEKLEDGYYVAKDQKAIETCVMPVNLFGTEADSKLRRYYIERQHKNVDALVNCVMKNIGFNNGKPIAAFTIYKCLLHWKSFEAERTSVFDRLIQMIGSAIEDQDGNDLMAYWLSNTSALLFLLEQSLKSGGVAAATPFKIPPNPTSLFGRMTRLLSDLLIYLMAKLRSFLSSPSSANLAAPALEVVHKVEAKYPALLFKLQLTAYLEKIYGTIWDNLKKELKSLLALCIQAPRTSKGTSRSGRSSGKDSPMVHWQSIIESLNNLLCTLKENFVPPVLIQKIFSQTFSYINVQLFNSNGEFVKAGLAELELWCCQAKEEYAGSSWDELKHLRQAVGFLVIHHKYRISYDEIINDLCPILSVQQLYRICTLFWDGNDNTRSVSPDVLSSLRMLMAEDSNNAQNDSFFLDDSSSIPFSVGDLSISLQEKDFSDMKPADELLENPAFQFLNEWT